MRFGSLATEQRSGHYIFQVLVCLNEPDPKAVQVGLYADPQNGDVPFRQPMQGGEPLVGSTNAFMYLASIPAARPASDYTPRLVSYTPGASVPPEAPFICRRDD